MNARLLVLSAVFILSTIGPNDSLYAGDKEWRRFGEAAAILWGVRALTGWDPVGHIVDYPRRHTEYRTGRSHQKPINVHIHYPPKSDERISAFPPDYTSAVTYKKQTLPTKSMDDPPDSYFDAPERNTTKDYSTMKDSSLGKETPMPNRDDAKPPVLVSKRVEGGYEIETIRVWIAPHWETKIIEGHWRGDTWVDTHTEKKWVEGKWKEEETRTLLER